MRKILDFIEVLSNETLEKIAPRLTDAGLRDVAAKLKDDFVFRYSESARAIIELYKGVKRGRIRARSFLKQVQVLAEGSNKD